MTKPRSNYVSMRRFDPVTHLVDRARVHRDGVKQMKRWGWKTTTRRAK